MIDAVTRQLVALALAEDLGPGDVTARLLPAEMTGRAVILAKSPLVFSGGEVFIEVFRQLDPSVTVAITAREGEAIEEGKIAGEVRGPARSILTGERTALNFLQRLCGIATFTRKC